MEKRKIALLGCGSAGRYLIEKIQTTTHLEVAFVWNRTPDRLAELSLPKHRLYHSVTPSETLQHWTGAHGPPDLVAEMAHPVLIEEEGAALLETASLFVSSLTALAHEDTEKRLRSAAARHALFVPTGAAWGIQDILKMERAGTLRHLRVTMRFHAAALRLESPLREKLADYLADPLQTGPCTLYEGPVRPLARLAPNNVNTMTCVAWAGGSIGLDGTGAILQADKNHHAHETTIELWGPGEFYVKTVRHNPARPGAVTGNETYASFWASLLAAAEQVPSARGVQFC